MNTLFTIIIVVQVVAALAIIGLVLVQHGKGADMGAAFGSGASGSLFGATGSSNFLSKSTGIAAAIFFGATLALAFVGNRQHPAAGGVMENLPTAPAVPATSAPAAPAASTQVPGNAAPSPGTPTNNGGQSSQIPK
jgi:preprotein translocase subunit SecG